MKSKFSFIIMIALTASLAITPGLSYGASNNDYDDFSPALQNGERTFSSLSYLQSYRDGSSECSQPDYGGSTPACNADSRYLITTYDTLNENANLGVTRDCQTYSTQFATIESSEVTKQSTNTDFTKNVYKTDSKHESAWKVGVSSTATVGVETEVGFLGTGGKASASLALTVSGETSGSTSNSVGTEEAIENSISQMNSQKNAFSKNTVQSDTFNLVDEKMDLNAFHLITNYHVNALTLVKPGGDGVFDDSKILKQDDGKTLTFRAYDKAGENYYNYNSDDGEFLAGPLLWKKEITKVDCSDPDRTPLSEPTIAPERIVPEVGRIFISPAENLAKVVVTDYDFVPIKGATVDLENISSFPISLGESSCPSLGSTTTTDENGSAIFYMSSEQSSGNIPTTNLVVDYHGADTPSPLHPDFDINADPIPDGIWRGDTSNAHVNFDGANDKGMFYDGTKRVFFMNGLREYMMDCSLDRNRSADSFSVTTPADSQYGTPAYDTDYPNFKICSDTAVPKYPGSYSSSSIHLPNQIRAPYSYMDGPNVRYVDDSAKPFHVNWKDNDEKVHRGIENIEYKKVQELRPRDVTISTWIKWTGEQQGMIAFNGVGSYQWYNLRVDANGQLSGSIQRQLQHDSNSGYQTITHAPAVGVHSGSVKIIPDVWTHVALVIDDGETNSNFPNNLAETPADNTRMVIYIDGQNVDESNVALAGNEGFRKYGTASSIFAIGARATAHPLGDTVPSSSIKITSNRDNTDSRDGLNARGYDYVFSLDQLYKGKIDEFLIYKNAMTDAEILNIYNSYVDTSLCSSVNDSSNEGIISVRYPSPTDPEKTIYGSVDMARTTLLLDSEESVSIWYPQIQEIDNTIVFNDQTPPNLFLPSVITKETETDEIAVAYTGITAFDIEDNDNVEVFCNPASGSDFEKGTTIVTCSATDLTKNIATGTFKVQVTDIGGYNIPEWLKNSAGWWGCQDSDTKIDDDAFLASLQWLAENDVLVVPSDAEAIQSTSDDFSWVKTPACWWSEGEIDNVIFAGSIQWLIENGIITFD